MSKEAFFQKVLLPLFIPLGMLLVSGSGSRRSRLANTNREEVSVPQKKENFSTRLQCFRQKI